ncbi:MAG: zinc ribbon domain-containing protein [Coriobacteriales bacterium]
MCFRPAEIKMNVCPKCGKNNKPIAKVCEECGEPLEMQKVDFDADQSKLDAANVSAPGAPAAPSPAAPKAPGAPQL